MAGVGILPASVRRAEIRDARQLHLAEDGCTTTRGGARKLTRKGLGMVAEPGRSAISQPSEATSDAYASVSSSVVGLPVWPARARRVEPSAGAMRLKRTLDLVVASAALLVALVPGLLIASLIRLGSPGPVFFRQRRVGRYGRHFEMLKFRTMVDNADSMKAELAAVSEADGLFKMRRDPRLTRLGAVLRQSYLDELPQLINVLRGEMSLVGPRPLIAEEDAAIEGSGRARLNVPPGMTGEWQVLRGGGASLDELRAADFRYVAEWSLWRDLRCLLKTAGFVVGLKGW